MATPCCFLEAESKHFLTRMAELLAYQHKALILIVKKVTKRMRERERNRGGFLLDFCNIHHVHGEL
jgi:hypothetical protein